MAYCYSKPQVIGFVKSGAKGNLAHWRNRQNYAKREKGRDFALSLACRYQSAGFLPMANFAKKRAESSALLVLNRRQGIKREMPKRKIPYDF